VGHRANTLRRAHRLIERFLDDETLSPATIAEALGLSTRYLNKLFGEEGTSMAKWMWNRRLDRCRDVLEAAEHAGRTISEIALSHGFKNISHFNRAFRLRFGAKPTDIRRRS
jgi:AraC family transcriptional activator of tynA and feaB